MKLTLDRNTIVGILMATIAVGYAYIYIRNRQYLVRDGFQNEASAAPASELYPPPNPILAPSSYPDTTLPATLRPSESQLPAASPAPANKVQGGFKKIDGFKDRATKAKEGFWQAGNSPFALDDSGKKFYEKDLIPTDPNNPNVISTVPSSKGYKDPWASNKKKGTKPWGGYQGSDRNHGSGSYTMDSNGNPVDKSKSSFSVAVTDLWKNMFSWNSDDSSWRSADGSIENNGEINVDVCGNLVQNPVFPGEPPTVTAAGTPLYSPDRPYATNHIDDMDGYEYNLVFQNEGDRSLSTGLRQKLMSQRPMDWAGLPSSSSEFQKGLAEQDAADANAIPPSTDQYNAINGTNMAPPDKASLEEKERQILQSYVPTGKGQTTYSAEDANTLINKIYTAKGLVPTVTHTDGTNVWQITSTRKVNEPIVYEDEVYAPAATGPNRAVGESTIQVPPAATDMAAAVDPYFDSTAPSGKTRAGKWNFQEWTPGLERMFAPTEPRQKWY